MSPERVWHEKYEKVIWILHIEWIRNYRQRLKLADRLTNLKHYAHDRSTWVGVYKNYIGRMKMIGRWRRANGGSHTHTKGSMHITICLAYMAEQIKRYAYRQSHRPIVATLPFKSLRTKDEVKSTERLLKRYIYVTQNALTHTFCEMLKNGNHWIITLISSFTLTHISFVDRWKNFITSQVSILKFIFRTHTH